MENEALVPKPNSLWTRHKENLKLLIKVLLLVLLVSSMVYGVFLYGSWIMKSLDEEAEEAKHVTDTTIPSMDFTVLNRNDTHLSVKWDLLIRIPRELPGYYICLRGDFQVFNCLQRCNHRYFINKEVSLINSEGDMDGVIVKNIMEDVKERGEIHFGSGLLLPDCRYGTSGKMNYACDEATLRFEPGSQRNATLFGNQPICHYLH